MSDPVGLVTQYNARLPMLLSVRGCPFVSTFLLSLYISIRTCCWSIPSAAKEQGRLLQHRVLVSHLHAKSCHRVWKQRLAYGPVVEVASGKNLFQITNELRAPTLQLTIFFEPFVCYKLQ
jgi:hypothetical protein